MENGGLNFQIPEQKVCVCGGGGGGLNSTILKKWEAKFYRLKKSESIPVYTSHTLVFTLKL